MALGDVYRASIIGDWAGSNVNVFTLHFKDISGSGALTTLGAALRVALPDLIKTYQSTGFFWRSINFLLVNRDPPTGLEYVTGFPLQGALSDNPVPYTCAICVTLITGYLGRSYRGRVYLPGFTEARSEGWRADSTLTGALATYFDDLVAAYGAAGSDANWQLGIWSRKLSLFTPVSETRVNEVWATQRRRRPGVGV